MSDHDKVRVEVLHRPYPRGGRTYRPGDELEVPAYALGPLLAANPPRVRVLPGQAVPELDADFDATEGALDLARAVGLDLTPFAGQGSGPGGRIQKPDVKEWIGQ